MRALICCICLCFSFSTIAGQRERLFKAAQTGKVATIRRILTATRVKVNDRLKERWGWSALHRAVAYNQVQATHVLVREFGASVESLDNGKWRPLHLAAHYGHFEVAIELIKNLGADCLAEQDGRTPANIAFKRGYTIFARYLQECAEQQKKTQIRGEHNAASSRGLASR